ncbi:hypothetical protein ACIQXV_18645 [Neobacillus sp. NPDC097160]|uniref:hypothetical protein n=1 Tax=Neobacillus sp. NPDC097160 TaxID=3364298 RepID=UPI00380F4B01
MMIQEHTYLLIDNSLYINLETNLLNLMYLLFFRAKPFTFLERKTTNKALNSFIPLVRLMRVLEFTYVFYRRRQIHYKSKDSFPTITTTFNGHCLIILRLGEYKIINFRKKDVTTVFPNDFIITEIEKNIYKLIEAQKCKLAPKIIDWDINRRYIKECYINLKNPTFDYDNNYHFCSDVLPILGNIMISIDPQVILVKQYINNLINCIDLLKETYLIGNSSPEDNNNIVLDFFTFIKKKIESYSSKKILLVLSHGDFWEGNVLKSKTTSSVIDWNTLDIRSLYFDFYFIMFDRASKIKETEWVIIIKEMDAALKYFQLYLIEKTHFNSEFTTSLINQSDIYRYLFYLEFILLRLQEYPKEDQNDWDFLGTWIKFFTLYENNKNEVSLLSM